MTESPTVPIEPSPPHEDNVARIDGQNLIVSFKQQIIFNIKALSFRQGDSILLQGANGAGKTSLMKVLAGLLKPEFGNLQHRAAGNTRFTGRQKLIGKATYLHQSPYVYSGTVLANLKMATPLLWRFSASAKARLAMAIEMAQLGHLLAADAAELSGGEKQRLALARVYLVQPALLMLDEPTANMDLVSQQLVLAMVEQLQQQGTGLMIVSHQSNSLTALCKQHWLLANKQLTICAKPRDVSADQVSNLDNNKILKSKT
ncbi:energy-coupling factor ABC transporter ATP-binding protein [Thalassotalea sp. HSM 43]|uniref:energy-coupling factor ABC transporter ATP-binding protein n=1 Tax=Thalassotalea sp. HSM 43 TaxID=2552945 RepID=UPI001081A774|nr:energy-coupling factor ABC transporter ATP-binding protein [Thalassotalea sp. HSM 43]QBY05265.1 energy-coupling factor ABC transporter ATP-binding protein [Thalassotalea sp. HSM 43]